MEIDRVDPGLRRFFERTLRPDVRRAWVRRLNRVAERLPFPTAAGVKIREIRNGPARYRLYEPETSTGAALVFIHGGGLVTGSPTLTDRFCARTARDLEMVVVSVRYRLAPRHRFPAALQDCDAVWRDVVARADLTGVDRRRIAVGGQSAGGGLAAALAQVVHDRGGVQPVAQVLIYPMLDDRTAANTVLDAEDHFLWNNVSNRYGWESYLGRPAGSDHLPEYAVPARREDLGGLPPAWIGVGDIDLFHEEDVAYARRLREAGVAVTLDVVPGAPHGFEALPVDVPLATDFHARAREWLREHVAG